MNSTNLRILKEAEKLFASKGFSKTSLQDLAAACKAGIGSIYHYYKNKDEILFAVLQRNLEEQLTASKAHLAGLTSPVAKLEKYIWFQFYHAQNYPDFSKLILFELRHRKELTKTPAYRYVREIVNLLVPILREGQERNVFIKTIDTITFRNMVWGTLEAFTRNWLIFKRPENILDFAPVVIRQIMAGITYPQPAEQESKKPNIAKEKRTNANVPSKGRRSGANRRGGASRRSANIGQI
jgi:TetR/AcrR family transcriptional regulator, fatty acid metabolism regulator protein